MTSLFIGQISRSLWAGWKPEIQFQRVAQRKCLVNRHPLRLFVLGLPLSLDPSFWLPIGNMKDVPRVRTVLQFLLMPHRWRCTYRMFFGSLRGFNGRHFYIFALERIERAIRSTTVSFRGGRNIYVYDA